MKIKIVFIISNLNQGGAEKQLATLVKGLNPEFFDISLLLYAVQVKPFYEELLTSKNINITQNKLRCKFFIFKIIEALLFLKRFLKKHDYDLVVSSLFMNNLFTRLAAPSSYKNKIITNMRTSLRNYSPLYIFFEKALIKHSFIVFNSKVSLEEFKTLIPAKHFNRLSLIYNGFETNIIGEKVKSPALVFGSLGRFSSEKNILQAVRVFREVEKIIPDCKLIIQGHRGNQFEEISKAAVSTEIEIRDKNPNIEAFYNSITVLLLTSVFEGCPNVLFEALLRKKICIISAGANADNFVVDGINGFVYDGTDDGLKQAIFSVIKIRNTPDELRIIENGYQYALRNFSVSSMVTKYEQLFMKIYEENKSRD